MKRKLNIIISALALVSMAFVSSCKEDVVERPFTVKQQTMLAEYIAAQPELSMFYDIASKAERPQNWANMQDNWVEEYRPNADGGIDTVWVKDSIQGKIKFISLLNSRATPGYTIFAPSNDAVTRYLAKIGRNSVSEMSAKELTDFMSYHMYLTQLNVRALITGLTNVSDSTVTGLRHHLDMNKGTDSIYMNKSARILNSIPKETFNGYVYFIDEALVPHENILLDYLNGQGKYSIFLDIAKQAGMDYLLKTVRAPHRDSVRRANANYEATFTTVLPVSDDNFKKAGYADAGAVLAQMRANPFLAADTAWTNHYGTDKDYLRLFFLYHTISGQYDLDRSGNNLFFYGKASYQFSDSARVIYTGVRDSFPGLQGYSINTIRSNNGFTPRPVLNGYANMPYNLADVYTKNGYVHEIDAPLFPIKNDVAATNRTVVEFEDLYFRYTGGLGTLSNANEPYSTFFTKESSAGTSGYTSNVSLSTSKPNAGDFAVGKALYFSPTLQNSWIEFVIRDLPKGRYRLRLNYRYSANAETNVLVYWRKSSNEFDPTEDRMKMDPLDLSIVKKTIVPDPINNPTYTYEQIVYKEFKQNRLMTDVVVDELGDYSIRFLHINTKPGEYDNLTLEYLGEVIE